MTVSTLNERRAALIAACYEHLPDKIARLIEEDDTRLPAFSLDRKGRISYAPKEIYRTDDARRVITTLGRFLSRFHNVEITPELETRISKVCAVDNDVELEFDIVDDVREAYTRCARNGVESCMTTDDDLPDGEEYLEFYHEIGVKCLVAYRNGEAIARALLWRIPDGPTLVDRIYPNDGRHIALYEKWAEANNAQLRPHQSAGIPSEWAHYRYPIHDFERAARYGVPYLDSFAYLSADGSYLSPQIGRDSVLLQCTDGSTPAYCTCCKQWGWNNADYELDGILICGDCYDERTTECAQCGERLAHDDMTEIDGRDVCSSCAASAEECEHCGDLTLDGLRRTADGEFVCSECYRSAPRCDGCGDRSYDRQTFGPDHLHLCASCFDDAEANAQSEITS